MKKLLLVLMALLPFNVYADWVKYSSNDAGNFYYDPSTIKRENTYRKVWALVDLKQATKNTKGQLFKSLTVYWYIDCNQDRNKLLQLNQYSGSMAAGNSVLTVNSDDGWEYIAPQTVGATLMRISCN